MSSAKLERIFFKDESKIFAQVFCRNRGGGGYFYESCRMLCTLYEFPLPVECLCRDLLRPLIQEMFVFSPLFFQ